MNELDFAHELNKLGLRLLSNIDEDPNNIELITYDDNKRLSFCYQGSLEKTMEVIRRDYNGQLYIRYKKIQGLN